MQVLYLHGNRIAKLKAVTQLAALPKLVKLTLHGNPVSEKKGCRLAIAAAMPRLRSLDFSAITRLDRDAVGVALAMGRAER
jgi:Leucine-rich repeat